MNKIFIASYITTTIIGLLAFFARWVTEYINYRGRRKIPITNVFFAPSGGLSGPIVFLIAINAIAGIIILHDFIYSLL